MNDTSINQKLSFSIDPNNPTFYSVGKRDGEGITIAKNKPEVEEFFSTGKEAGCITRVQENSENRIEFWFTKTDNQTHQAIFDVLNKSVEILN